MSRLRIAIGIIAALLLLCGSAVWGVGVQTGRLLIQVRTLEEAVRAEDYPAAAQTEQQLSRQWERTTPWLRVAVSKSEVQAVSESIARIRPMIETENDELSAELAVLRDRLTELQHSEYPTADRIF